MALERRIFGDDRQREAVDRYAQQLVVSGNLWARGAKPITRRRVDRPATRWRTAVEVSICGTIGPEPSGATPIEDEDLEGLIPDFVATAPT